MKNEKEKKNGKRGVIFLCVVMMKERVICRIVYRPQVDRRRKGEHPKKKKKKIAVGEFFLFLFFFLGGGHPLYVSLHLILLLFDRFVV